MTVDEIISDLSNKFDIIYPDAYLILDRLHTHLISQTRSEVIKTYLNWILYSDLTDKEYKIYLKIVRLLEQERLEQEDNLPDLINFITHGERVFEKNKKRPRCPICKGWDNYKKGKEACQDCCKHPELEFNHSHGEDGFECKICNKLMHELKGYKIVKED